MRLVKTATITKDAYLGKSIYNDKGRVLLNEGVKLKANLLRRLNEMGIHYIYVKDKLTDDIKVMDPISGGLRRKAITSIESNFLEVQNGKYSSCSLFKPNTAKDFSKLIQEILCEIKGNSDLLVLLADVYSYDHYIFTHSLNVTLYTLAIGLQLKLPDKDLGLLGLGAILHDVGKMKIPENILLKPGRLTKEEFEQIKRHAEEGFHLLRKIPTLSVIVAHCAFQHHERLNGSGYPRGITENEIHPFGKIIAVADVFDAVTSNRVYRQAMLPHEGLEILYAGSGTLFDSKIIEAFRKAVAIYPTGIGVVLNDGRKGIVSAQNAGLSERPIIRILEENGIPLKEAYELNLKNKLDMMIISCDTTFK